MALTEPSEHLSLKEISAAYEELLGLRKQVAFKDKKIADLENKYFDSQKKLRETRVALGRAERASPLNPNDEELLFAAQANLSFERPFAGGKKLTIRGYGRRLVTVTRKSEGQSLIDEALRKIRAAIRKK